MQMIPFESFEKIQPFKKLFMSITQKIHGTNGQIYVYKIHNSIHVIAGSRNRWLSLDSDNAGFCRYVEDNREEIIEKLGQGRHFGEWCGNGINAGEGLVDKRFLLFDWQRWSRFSLPESCGIVPVLYTGQFSLDAIDHVMLDLKTNGSRLVPGYMKPEGIVIELGDQRFKKVFDTEEVAWSKNDVARPHISGNFYMDVSHLLQPERLKKILGRDEQYLRDYPKNMRELFNIYVKDLWDENQIDCTEDEKQMYYKSLARSVYPFIRSVMEEL